MQIITKLPTYSDGQINKALERELRLGLQYKKVTERVREERAAKEAQSMRGSREVPGLGRHVASIPAWEYFRMKQKYGHDEVHSDGFVKYLQKTYPHLATSRI
jgi:hypothetical protein